MTSDSTKQPTTRRSRTLWFVAFLCILLPFGVIFLSNGYWLDQAEATKRAEEFVKQSHPNLEFKQILVWKRWNGHWVMEFESAPPVMIDVDRHGGCTEN